MHLWSLLLVGCAPSRPDILLVTFDTTRADAVGAYGRSPSPTPNLDALAASGSLVLEAMAVAPLTLPAHAAMLTGLAPVDSAIHGNLGRAVSSDAVTVAESLRAAGWQTDAVVASVVLDRTFGLDQGFDQYIDGFDFGLGKPRIERPADDVAAEALKLLASADADQPLFLWVHFYDPHQPLVDRGAEDAYLGEVAFADASLGTVLAAMRARGRELGVVVAGDHGEGRADHAEVQHGLFVYRTTMHVPMIAAGPGVATGTIDGPRSSVDVAATLLAFAGLAAPAGSVPLQAPGAASRVVVGESYHPRWQYGLADLHVAEDARWRYIRAPREELYDWRADPDETTNVFAANPDVAQRLATALPSTSATGASGDAEVAGALAALGYLEGMSAVPDDAASSGLVDPKDALMYVAEFDALVTSARSRQPAKAVPMLEAFVAAHPEAGAAWYLLSRARDLSGDAPGALEALAPLRTARPDDPMLAGREAELWLAAGDVGRADALLSELVERRAAGAGALGVYAEVARRQGDCRLAISRADAALAVAPTTTAARLVRGACRYEGDDPVGAVADLEAVYAVDPTARDVVLLLSLAQLRIGRGADAIPALTSLVAREPDRPVIAAALGAALHSAGRYAEAAPWLAATAGDPSLGGDPAVLYADVLLRTGGSADEAAAWLDRAAIDGASPMAVWRARSAVAMARGDTAGAVEAMRNAGEGAPAEIGRAHV